MQVLYYAIVMCHSIISTKDVPRFEGITSGLNRYLEDIEMICQDRE